jgi:hypothetical protein
MIEGVVTKPLYCNHFIEIGWIVWTCYNLEKNGWMTKDVYSIFIVYCYKQFYRFFFELLFLVWQPQRLISSFRLTSIFQLKPHCWNARVISRYNICYIIVIVI